jgi:hypothetical protein
MALGAEDFWGRKDEEVKSWTASYTVRAKSGNHRQLKRPKRLKIFEGVDGEGDYFRDVA